MNGDFSQLRPFDPAENFNGVLHQQGRVLTDPDWNDQTRIVDHWQIRAGRDVIGDGVAAVPANAPDSFRAQTAQAAGGAVTLEISPGHIWADGLLVYLGGDPAKPVSRDATYLEAPIQDPNTIAPIGDKVRDAVILEVSREAFNAFQSPERLIEPALGGPDTTERILTRFAFRLLRLAADEDCHSIGNRLKDDPNAFGKLTVSLQPTVVIPGECPVVEGGGYTGFEHQTYRIEVAETNAGGPKFKWSQFNGGLVGRGNFRAGATPRVQIAANLTAILTCGLTEFYLEAVEFDTLAGVWRPTYGAKAVLNNQQELELGTPVLGTTLPGAGGQVFFRLWNGLLNVSDFTSPATELVEGLGIQLEFEAPAGKTYRPGDYWVFTVRAGEIKNPQTLIDAQPPQGIRYHRVPLAELNWNAALSISAPLEIEDCRRRFRPLTNQRVCCTFLIGDDISSFGDFNSIEEAALHLPMDGGELCFLPGIHAANLVLKGRRNVTIHGCGERTRVFPRENQTNRPIFRFEDCDTITVRDLDLVTLEGPGIEADGSAWGKMTDLKIESCRVVAGTVGIAVWHGRKIRVFNSVINILDRREGREALLLQADEALVWRNLLGVVPAAELPPEPPRDGDDQPDPTDPCADLRRVYGLKAWLVTYARHLFGFKFLSIAVRPYRALGGIHLLGGCEKVRIVENQIIGGRGNGITVGGPWALDGAEVLPPGKVMVTVGERFIGVFIDEQGAPLGNVDVHVGDKSGTTDKDTGVILLNQPNGEYELSVGPDYQIVKVERKVNPGSPSSTHLSTFAYYIVTLKPVDSRPLDDRGFLYEIGIEQNEICRMGLSGIGFGQFKIEEAPVRQPVSPLLVEATVLRTLPNASIPLQLAAVANLVRDLVIRENRIHHCLLNPFTEAQLKESRTIGQGGISLSLCEGLLVNANHIYDNGTRALDPVCGVFIAFGEDLEIRENTIYNNGPWRPTDERAQLAAGVRGGIFIWLAAAISMVSDSTTNHRPALRVLDNRVDQPAGRALTTVALGSVSCSGNHFNCEYIGPSLVDRFVGGVLIANLGGVQNRLYAAQLPVKSQLQPRTALSKFTIIHEAAEKAEKAETFLGVSGGFGIAPVGTADFPGGDTLFNNNQVRLGANNECLIAQLIASLDDVGYDGNQSWAYNRSGTVANALALGHTLRATDSRFRELGRNNLFSLFTYSVAMNVTAHNQGDHCIIAGNAHPNAVFLKLLKDDNQELDASRCHEIRKAGANRNLLEILFENLLDRLKTPLPDASLASDLSSLSALARTSLMLFLRQVRHLVALQRVQFQTELLRIKPILGASHFRVLKYEARLRKSAEIGKELAAEAELAEISPVKVTAKTSAIEGRISGGNLLGAENMRVILKDAAGRPVNLEATTDSVGYYAIAIDEDDVRSFHGKKVFLHVEDPEGREVFRKTEPLDIKPDTRLRITMVAPQLAPELAILETLPVKTETARPAVPGRTTAPERAIAKPKTEPTPAAGSGKTIVPKKKPKGSTAIKRPKDNS